MAVHFPLTSFVSPLGLVLHSFFSVCFLLLSALTFEMTIKWGMQLLKKKKQFN